MFYQQFIPTPCLQPYIEQLWILETDSSDPYSMEKLITPNGAEGLILTYRKADQGMIINAKRFNQPQACLFIQPTTPFVGTTEGYFGSIGVFFKAGSLHMLLKTCMTQVVGQVIEAEAFLGSQPIRVLLEQLTECQSNLRINLVERFLSRYFCNVTNHLATARFAVNLIRQYSGMVNIETIAHQLSISRRAIDKQFVEKVGISPKHYSQIIRFTTLQRYLKHHPHASWLDITHRFGYYDQSHLIKDFYRFTGSSPVDYSLMDTSLMESYLLPEISTNNF